MDLRRQLAVVALVYVIEGFPMGAYSSVFKFYFASQHVALASIGLLGSLRLAWSLKVVWSPIVERFGTRQQWIAGALIAMAGALCVIAWLPGNPIGLALWMVLAIYCAASATQDIAIDAYTIGLVDRSNLGPANAVRTAAYRVGMIASSSGLLLLPDRFGWDKTFLAGAAISLLLAAALAATPAISLPPLEERRPVRALLRWLRRPGAPSVIAFIVLFRIGDFAMGEMLTPFWVARGFGPAEYGAFSGLLGALFFVAGGVVAGAWMPRAGMIRALWITGALALVSNLGYAAVAAWPGGGKLAVYAAGAVESATSGAVGAVFVAYLMSICDPRYAAVEYALVTSLYAVAGALLAGTSGWITEALGYAGYFALTAAFAAPAFAFLSRAARWIEPAAEER
ncbi:MAG TPA: MFS transporter [Myxococcota bacterium]|nr:MFS transporter [Myxococcota bacterium]